MAAAARMGLGRVTLAPGFLSNEEFAALLDSSLAVVFPSLFEGFGIPVVEAMSAGRPVLCSNVTSLPEVAGGAALLFDPRKPDEIAASIERIVEDSELRATLVGRGRLRAAELGTPEKMAAAYWKVMREAAGQHGAFDTVLHGAYADGWTAERLTVTCGEGAPGRRARIVLEAPGSLPWPAVTLEVSRSDIDDAEELNLERGTQTAVEAELPTEGGWARVTVSPYFQPSAYGSPDTRLLGCRLKSCQILDPDGTTRELGPGAGGAA